MPRPNEREMYRVYAAKCFELARKTSDSETWLALLQMARAWRLLADRADNTAPGKARVQGCGEGELDDVGRVNAGKP
jgi:hypothetical protein